MRKNGNAIYRSAIYRESVQEKDEKRTFSCFACDNRKESGPWSIDLESALRLFRPGLVFDGSEHNPFGKIFLQERVDGQNRSDGQHDGGHADGFLRRLVFPRHAFPGYTDRLGIDDERFDQDLQCPLAGIGQINQGVEVRIPVRYGEK